MKYVILFVIVSALSFCVFLANYLGAFRPVEVLEGDRGPLRMVYLDYMGPYHKTVSAIEKVEKWFAEQKLPCQQSYGEYLDKPDSKEENRLRSRGGCLIPETLKLPPLPPEFKEEIRPLKHYVIAEFFGSPGIGPFKVYPKVNDYIAAKRKKPLGSAIEIYEILNASQNDSMKTTYLIPYE